VSARAGIACLVALAAVAGCGSTERSGSVGEKLAAKGLRVTVERVDRSVPVPERDVTGLALPGRGFKLVGVRVRVCSDHGGAIGPWAFGIETSDGAQGRAKYPERNYEQAFEPVRDSCGHGWVVFEIPARSTPARVKFGFEDTGSARLPQTRVDARFTWKVE
jgi:hypothetical protein